MFWQSEMRRFWRRASIVVPLAVLGLLVGKIGFDTFGPAANPYRLKSGDLLTTELFQIRAFEALNSFLPKAL